MPHVAAEIARAPDTSADVARATARNTALVGTEISSEITSPTAGDVRAAAQAASSRANRTTAGKPVRAPSSGACKATHSAATRAGCVGTEPSRCATAELARALIDRLGEVVGPLAYRATKPGRSSGHALALLVLAHDALLRSGTPYELPAVNN
ncbi:hypothetical protein [Methylobacterium isbiliense]|uniref:hypothetical protein n=1 Tax=Methylobacterium isbiliense TaxID=315478 RepID=UPI001EE29B50|nr:hypothetical protein [Methylobacterium isbiliense]MDN3627910.1 hypothetical protein [Methylobacterium isbiliense]